MQIRSSGRPIDRNHPVLAVKDGCVVSRRADVTVGWELSLPVVYSLEERDYAELFSGFASAVRRLDPYCIVHKMDVYMTRKYSPRGEERFLADAYERHFDGRPYLEHRCYLFLTKSTKANCEAPVAGSGILSFARKQCPHTAADLRDFALRAGEFVTTFCGTRIGFRELDDDDYLGVGDSFGLFDMHRKLFREGPLFEDQKFFNDRVEVGPDTLQVFSVGEADLLPGVIENTRGVEKLSTASSTITLSYGSRLGIGLEVDHIVNQYVMTLPQEGVKSEIGLRLRRMKSGAGNAANDVAFDELTAFLRVMEGEGEVTVKAHLNVMTWVPDGMKDFARSQVTRALSDIGVTASCNSFDAPVAWYASIPGAASELGVYNWMHLSLGSAVALTSYETFDRGMESGTLALCDRMTHVPVRLDFRYEAARLKLITNYNKFLVGPSGSGKSFWTNHYLHSCYEAGEHVFVIDKGGSYMGLCSVIREESGGADGIYYAWDKKTPINFDPFLGVSDWLSAEGALQTEETGLICFVSFLETIWAPEKGWSSDNEQYLYSIIRDFIILKQGVSGLVFDDFYRFVEDSVMPRILAEPSKEEDASGEVQYFYEGERIEPYRLGRVVVDRRRLDIGSFLVAMSAYVSTGSHGRLLNDPAPKDLLGSRFTVFDVDRLAESARRGGDEKEDPFYGVVIMFLMNAIDHKMRSILSPKQVSIDEAWQALKNPAMANFLQTFYKTGRKFQCGFMVITQQLSDLKKSPVVADAIIKNSDVKILLDQSSNQNDFKDGVETLGLTQKDVNLVMSMGKVDDPRYNYRECFIKWGSRKSGVYALEVSLEEALVFESEFEKKEPVLKLAEQLGSYRKAVAESAKVLRAGRRP